MSISNKIAILGAGNVGATIAFTLTASGTASEIVLIDVNQDKAKGEAMDIIQGTPFCAPVDVYASDYAAAAGAGIVILTAGAGRKPGQTRLDLTQGNVNIVNSIMPNIVKYAPGAIYIVVSNPVDVLTYLLVHNFGLRETQVIGSGTMLDSARLRSSIAQHVHLNPRNVHAYVFGEHGDTSMIPWSLTSIAGMTMDDYCDNVCPRQNRCGKVDLKHIEEDMRTAGGKVIKLKNATFYAVSLAVRRIVECIAQDAESVLTVSGMVHDRYGIDDVCLSLPFVVGSKGIVREITPPLKPQELAQLQASAQALKETIASVDLGSI